MPKHNNEIPRNHFRKHWNPESSQKGHVKTFFQQPMQKKSRRIRRQQKAKLMFPRPAGGCLRPVVQSCSQRYNMKTRAGKGFTLEEIKAAGLCSKYARTIGVAVDHRRRNHCEESLAANTQRLKEYVSKLVLFPLKGGAKAQGPVAQASADALKAVAQDNSRSVMGAGLKPKKEQDAPRDLTKDEKSRHIYNYLRAQNRNEKFIGIRLSRKLRKEKKEKADK
ncbi:60S ribosomal protein L13-2 [Diplonema papillatum]|nr:60S ribosomal protein L13-2 [Diplonema papillatum]KAJ9450634.1 60S ribosomal protein L13-2 [Diplonema papillatum]